MYNDNGAYIALFLVAGVIFVLSVVTLSQLLAPSRPGVTKMRPYECGEIPTSGAWVQYNVHYYLFAMLFLLFDVEAAFLIPWAVAFRTMIMDGKLLLAVADVVVFLGVLGSALAYAWRKGALKWV
jgi:NADH-quinone oxidoreductase subunit A